MKRIICLLIASLNWGVLGDGTMQEIPKESNLNVYSNYIATVRDFISAQKYDEARKLCLQFLSQHPNDAMNQELLGLIYMKQHDYEKAEDPLVNAYLQGRTNNLPSIIYIYQLKNNLLAISNLIPQMLEYKNQYPILIDDLIWYCFQQKPPNKLLFYKAIEDVSNEDIVRLHFNDIQSFFTGFKKFGDIERLEKLNSYLSIYETAAENQQAAGAAKLDKFECDEVVSKYEQNPEIWPKDRLLTIAIVYFKESEFDKSRAIYEKMRLLNRNDAHVYAGLGNCYLFQTNFDEAIQQYRKAWTLGDSNVLQTLAVAYLASKTNLDRMSDLIPVLMQHKSKNLVFILAYAANSASPDRKLFTNAIRDVTDDELLSDEKLTKLAIAGFKQFGEESRAKNLEMKLKAASHQ